MSLGALTIIMQIKESNTDTNLHRANLRVFQLLMPTSQGYRG